MNSVYGKKTDLVKYAVANRLPIEYVSIDRNSVITAVKHISKLESSGLSISRIVKHVMESERYNIKTDHVIFLWKRIFGQYDLNQVNIAMIQSNLTPFSDETDFEERYSRWEGFFESIYFRTVILHSRIQDVISSLVGNGETSIQAPEITYSKSTVSYNTLPSTELKIDWDITSVFDLIDHCVVSQYVPFIQAPNSTQGSVYKMFYSDSEDLINEKFVFFTQDKFDQEHIYFYVWNGRNVNNKNSYSEMSYDVKNGLLEINSNSVGTEDVQESIDVFLSHISFSMPFFKFVRGESKYVNADVVFENVSMNLNIFYFMVDQDWVISSYLSLFECTNVRHSDKRPMLLYNNIIPNEYNITIKLSHKIIHNSTALVASVNGATNGQEMNEVANVLRYIIQRYTDLQEVFAYKIGNRFGDVPEIEKIKYDLPSSRIKALSADFPDLFGSDLDKKNSYSSSCQKNYQPIIIADDEIDSWENLLVDGQKRQIAEFPPPREGVEKMFNYVCPNDSYPWPSLIVNKAASQAYDMSKPIYKMVPCCCKVDRYEQYLSHGTGTFARYYKEEKKIRKEKVFKTFKVVKEGSMGMLPSIVETHLEMSENIDMYISALSSTKTVDLEDDEEVEEGAESHYLHYSVGQELDSFVKCLIFATDSRETSESVRNKMSLLHPSLYAQENVAGTRESLINKILYGYVDPLLTYRGLEILFNVNIYIFNSETYEPMTPYHNVAHIRYPREDRRCVLIWYHPTMKVSELIVHLKSLNSEGKKNKQKTFGLNMNRRMYNVTDSHYLMNQSGIYENVFKSNDWEKFFVSLKSLGWFPSNQFIDSNGKCRGFNVYNSLEEINLTMLTLPSQPLNLDSEEFTITRVDSKTAIDFVGKIPSTRNLDGYWFSFFEIEEYLFVPIYFDNLPKQHEEIPVSKNISPVEDSEKTSLTNRVKAVMDASKLKILLKELIWWCFVVDKSRPLKPEHLDQWFDRWVKVKDVVVDEYKDVQKLAIVQDTRSALEFLKKYYPEMFSDFIYLPARVRDNMYGAMKLMVKENEALVVEPQINIRKKYNTEKDFNQIGNKTFLSLDDMKIWLSKSSTGKYFKFIESFDEIQGNNPAVLRDESFYIVQKERRLESAIWNSYQFIESKVNVPDIPEIPKELPPYVIYLMENGKLRVKKNYSASSDYAEVVEVGDEIYSLLYF